MCRSRRRHPHSLTRTISEYHKTDVIVCRHLCNCIITGVIRCDPNIRNVGNVWAAALVLTEWLRRFFIRVWWMLAHTLTRTQHNWPGLHFNAPGYIEPSTSHRAPRSRGKKTQTPRKCNNTKRETEKKADEKKRDGDTVKMIYSRSVDVQMTLGVAVRAINGIIN